MDCKLLYSFLVTHPKEKPSTCTASISRKTRLRKAFQWRHHLDAFSCFTIFIDPEVQNLCHTKITSHSLLLALHYQYQKNTIIAQMILLFKKYSVIATNVTVSWLDVEQKRCENKWSIKSFHSFICCNTCIWRTTECTTLKIKHLLNLIWLQSIKSCPYYFTQQQQ